MDWKKMSYRPHTDSLYGESIKERLRNQAGGITC